MKSSNYITGFFEKYPEWNTKPQFLLYIIEEREFSKDIGLGKKAGTKINRLNKMIVLRKEGKGLNNKYRK